MAYNTIQTNPAVVNIQLQISVISSPTLLDIYSHCQVFTCFPPYIYILPFRNAHFPVSIELGRDKKIDKKCARFFVSQKMYIFFHSSLYICIHSSIGILGCRIHHKIYSDLLMKMFNPSPHTSNLQQMTLKTSRLKYGKYL